MVLFEALVTLATEKVGETILAGMNAQLNPSDLEACLK